MAIAPAARRIRGGAWYVRRARIVATSLRRTSRRRGRTIRTTNSTMNGSAGARPPTQVTVAEYFSTSALATPIRRPPAKVSGRLVK